MAGSTDSTGSSVTATSGTSALFALAVASALALLTLNGSAGPASILAQLSWISFVGLVAFLILRTGRISRWRALFFVVLAWAFVLHFKAALLGLRGSAFFSPDIQEVPTCHIAISSSILNYAYFEYLAFKSGHWLQWGPLSLGFLWLIVTLAIGQAWCSWGCVYGGLDDGFSRLLRRPVLKWLHLPARLRDLPAGVLLFMALLSLSTLLPVFCLWVCPLKITTAFLDPNDTLRKIQLTIFVVIGLLTLIAVPILTKKRVFCGLICPFGAWQALFGRLNPFRVSIRADRCTQCRLCLKACPTFAISQNGLSSPSISAYCNRCGECVDVCPETAIDYTVLGRETPYARHLFLFSVLVMGGAIGGLFVPDLLLKWAAALRGLSL